MNFNNFTIKSQEAVQEALNLAKSRGQQAIEPVHVMQGVMKVGENVTNFIFQKLGMNGQQIALVLDKLFTQSFGRRTLLESRNK